MKKLLLIVSALFLVLSFSVTVEARPRHRHKHFHHARHHVHHVHRYRSHHVRRHGAIRQAGGRPARWCGWYMGKVFGLTNRELWIARNWARIGTPSTPRPGVVAVWPHHVGRVEAVSGNQILVHSGNDGHAVRTRWRSIRGAIAFRAIF